MKRNRLLTGILVLVSTLLLAACSSSQSPRDLGEGASSGAGDYIIGAGDELQIYVRNHPDLSVSLPVRPDGRISVPMVQDVPASGKSPSELAGELERELSRYIRDPNVTVMVMSFVGSYDDQVRIIGQAVQPQAIAYRDGMTVLDAIIQVGGLTQFAAGNRARLVRGSGDNASSYRLRLNDLLNDGDMRQNHRLRPGDVIVIPEAFF
ncbi:MAG: polysaccharide export protein [Ectothiorhodospiraceae bacterium]|nr:polysaccharide export protein [Ectothiorhodospiraceae bacterium]